MVIGNREFVKLEIYVFNIGVMAWKPLLAPKILNYFWNKIILVYLFRVLWWIQHIIQFRPKMLQSGLSEGGASKICRFYVILSPFDILCWWIYHNRNTKIIMNVNEHSSTDWTVFCGLYVPLYVVSSAPSLWVDLRLQEYIFLMNSTEYNNITDHT